MCLTSLMESSVVSTETTASVEAQAQADVIHLRTASTIAIEQLSDADLLAHRDGITAEKKEVYEQFCSVERLLDAEITRRIDAAGGRALVLPTGAGYELTDEYSPWAYDMAKLRDAAYLLPDSERVKVIKHVPERTEITPAHDEPGAAVSMTALAKKYGENSPFGVALAEARTRAHVGKRLTKIKGAA